MSENKNFFRASAEDFKKIPGSPVAYWMGRGYFELFEKGVSLATIAPTRKGMFTGDNDRYLKLWQEISWRKFGVEFMAYSKGGSFRRWYGNYENVIHWGRSGEIIRQSKGAGNIVEELYFKPCITWSLIASGHPSFRAILSNEFVMGDAGPICSAMPTDMNFLLGYLNTCIVFEIGKLMAPTINCSNGVVGDFPVLDIERTTIERNVAECIKYSHCDWDRYEGSWDFAVNPLVAERGVSGQSVVGSEQNGGLITDHCPLSTLYSRLREKWAKDCEEMRRLETENNRIFIEAYGLQDELTPEVPWHEITLTCNPWYRYSAECGVQSAELPRDGKLEERLKGDTVKELISYAVGCMMGRYSLEKPGLILADQGAQISDQWIVVSGQLVLRGKVAECVRKELQRIDCLAEGDGSCGRSVSTGETAPDGGTVCIVGSASSGGGFNSVECRRGAGAEYDAGLHELSDNGTRVVLRDGNTIVDLCSAEVLDAIASGSGAELVRRGWKDAERIDWKTIHSSLTTSHFSPDKDGIIPILDNDWFADDIVTRFKEFIKVAFGEVHFFENMTWIEEALGKNLRDYFTKDFYKDHLQRYQNRPIYWLFQSPKGAFRALVYMHRYKPDMVGGVLGYLRSLQTKIDNQLDVAMQIGADESKSSSARVRANKDAVKYAKVKKELDEYEKNVLYPLSTERIEIDLDDGVKANYKKFGTALRKVAALEERSAE